MKRGILRKLSKKHGVSVAEIRKDMEAAVDETFKVPNNAELRSDFKGSRPSLEEFIAYAERKVRNEMK